MFHRNKSSPAVTEQERIAELEKTVRLLSVGYLITVVAYGAILVRFGYGITELWNAIDTVAETLRAVSNIV